MTMQRNRTFEDKPATRERVPLLIGLVGPSGGGKTFSALRLATGIQKVSGGDIYVVDTEARRALHYADRFRFRHVDFGQPFGSLDYLAAVEHCVKKGAGVVIIDSMSHEHEGPGGLLEVHEAEALRLARAWNRTDTPTAQQIERAKMSAWQAPKRNRRRLINTLLQLPCNFIFCFRAKEKLKIKKGEDPKPLGYMAIAGEEFVFEMTLNALLLPGAGGVPTWQSDEAGEKQQIKLPGWAQPMLHGGPLDEETGESLARWAAGTVVRGIADLVASYETCTTPAALGPLEVERRALWSKASREEKAALKTAADAAQARVAAAIAEPEPAPMTEAEIAAALAAEKSEASEAA